MLQLQTRDLPAVKYRRVLPEYKPAFGNETFLEIDARPAGLVNPAYIAATEQLRTETELRQASLAKIEGDPVAVIEFHAKTGFNPMVDHLIAIFDTCVIEWRCNLKDGDGAIVTSREKFVELANEAASSIFLRMAFVEFIGEVMKAGNAALAEISATAKN